MHSGPANSAPSPHCHCAVQPSRQLFVAEVATHLVEPLVAVADVGVELDLAHRRRQAPRILDALDAGVARLHPLLLGDRFELFGAHPEAHHRLLGAHLYVVVIDLHHPTAAFDGGLFDVLLVGVRAVSAGPAQHHLVVHEHERRIRRDRVNRHVRAAGLEPAGVVRDEIEALAVGVLAVIDPLHEPGAVHLRGLLPDRLHLRPRLRHLRVGRAAGFHDEAELGLPRLRAAGASAEIDVILLLLLQTHRDHRGGLPLGAEGGRELDRLAARVHELHVGERRRRVAELGQLDRHAGLGVLGRVGERDHRAERRVLHVPRHGLGRERAARRQQGENGEGQQFQQHRVARERRSISHGRSAWQRRAGGPAHGSDRRNGDRRMRRKLSQVCGFRVKLWSP